MTLDFFCSSLRRSLEVVHALPREMRIIRGVKKKYNPSIRHNPRYSWLDSHDLQTIINNQRLLG